MEGRARLFVSSNARCVFVVEVFVWLVAPARVSERGAKVQSRELAAICDDAESGLPHRVRVRHVAIALRAPFVIA